VRVNDPSPQVSWGAMSGHFLAGKLCPVGGELQMSAMRYRRQSTPDNSGSDRQSRFECLNARPDPKCSGLLPNTDVLIIFHS